MPRIYHLLLLLISRVAAYSQTDYIVIFERVEVVSQNEDIIHMKIHNFKYNRTHTAVNVTVRLNQDIGNHVMVSVQAYKFASNEYRQFPLVFSRNACDVLKMDEFGAKTIYNCGNMTKCPAVKGLYTICNWSPPYEKFPPYMPHGSYRVDFTFSSNSVEFLHFQGYGTVKGTKFP